MKKVIAGLVGLILLTVVSPAVARAELSTGLKLDVRDNQAEEYSYLYTGGTDQALMQFSLEAIYEDVEIEEITLGIAGSSYLGEVTLYEGAREVAQKQVGGSSLLIKIDQDEPVIYRGRTKDFYITGDIEGFEKNRLDNELRIWVQEIRGRGLNTDEYYIAAGSAYSNTFQIINTGLMVDYAWEGTSSNYGIILKNDPLFVADFTAAEGGESEQDILIEKIRLNVETNILLEKLWLYDETRGREIKDLGAVNSSQVLEIDLSPGYEIPRGETRRISVRAQVAANPETARSIRISVNNLQQNLQNDRADQAGIEWSDEEKTYYDVASDYDAISGPTFVYYYGFWSNYTHQPLKKTSSDILNRPEVEELPDLYIKRILSSFNEQQRLPELSVIIGIERPELIDRGFYVTLGVEGTNDKYVNKRIRSAEVRDGGTVDLVVPQLLNKIGNHLVVSIDSSSRTGKSDLISESNEQNNRALFILGEVAGEGQYESLNRELGRTEEEIEEKLTRQRALEKIRERQELMEQVRNSSSYPQMTPNERPRVNPRKKAPEVGCHLIKFNGKLKRICPNLDQE